MADLLIRGMDAATKKRLEAQARRNGRSQSAEALALLERGLRADGSDWVGILRHAAEFSGGYQLELPERRLGRGLDTGEWA